MRIGTKVKVIRSVDEEVPVSSCYMNKSGVVIEINNDMPAPVSVKFENGCIDSFWKSELKRIK